MSHDDHEQWLLSYYRHSEIAGSLFFGRLARSIRKPEIQHDLTRHYADEAQHAWLWTDCMRELETAPLRIGSAYQDQYLEAAGIPSNLMEVLAITLTFEKRVIRQYAEHRLIPGTSPAILTTISRIMEDERWHIEWVSRALKNMHPQYGETYIQDTLERYRHADEEVYAKTMQEYAEQLHQFAELQEKHHG